MSIDQIFSHIKWVQWIKENLDIEIKFPVIAANDTIANRLGMLHPGKGTNTVRAVFIGDPEGKVRLVLYYPQEIGRNIDEVLRAVKALQISDKQGAMPAQLAEQRTDRRPRDRAPVQRHQVCGRSDGKIRRLRLVVPAQTAGRIIVQTLF